MATTKQPPGDLTLPELVDALPSLLAGGYDGARSGRIRDLPDARTVRWYQTLGIVDRPAAFRGRTALYGRRHLLQLAAIKKLQSSGFPLADIQRGMAGKNDAELARSAGTSRRDADLVIERSVQTRSSVAKARLAAAVAGEANRPSRRDSAFWKSKIAPKAPDAAAEGPARIMQSCSLGAVAMLLWNGRALTASEQEKLRRLAGPLVTFLQSVQSSAAGTSAERVAVAVSAPCRPEEGARP